MLLRRFSSQMTASNPFNVAYRILTLSIAHFSLLLFPTGLVVRIVQSVCLCASVCVRSITFERNEQRQFEWPRPPALLSIIDQSSLDSHAREISGHAVHLPGHSQTSSSIILFRPVWAVRTRSTGSGFDLAWLSCLPSASVSLVYLVLYVEKCLITSFSLPFSVLNLWDWPFTWKTIILQCYYTVNWVIWPVKSSPKWPIMCQVGRTLNPTIPYHTSLPTGRQDRLNHCSHHHYSPHTDSAPCIQPICYSYSHRLL